MYKGTSKSSQTEFITNYILKLLCFTVVQFKVVPFQFKQWI